jgi:hypothetical protein
VLTRERIWWWVTKRQDNQLLCVLSNHPLATHTQLDIGATLSIPIDSIIDLETDQAKVKMQENLDSLTALGFTFTDEQVISQPITPTSAPNIRTDQKEVCERVGLLPYPPSMGGLCLMAKNMAEGHQPIYGARFESRPERNDNGWVFYTEIPDFEFVANQIGFDIVPIHKALQIRPEIGPYLSLPNGWGFTCGDQGDDIYPVMAED